MPARNGTVHLGLVLLGGPAGQLLMGINVRWVAPALPS
jgi:hypothetical protein